MYTMVRVPPLHIVARDIIKMAVFAPHVRMVGQHRDTRPQGLVRVIYPQVHLCQIRQEHIHAAQMRIMPTDKNPACAGFFMWCCYLSQSLGTTACGCSGLPVRVLFRRIA